MTSTRIFVHGLDSSSKGTKGTFFRENYPDMILVDFPGSLEQRMAILTDVLKGKEEIVLVGSSFGGLMATLFTLDNEERVKRLVLLAPALNLVGRGTFNGRRIEVPTWIYHGLKDEVIPIEEVRNISQGLFKKLSFVELDDDHNLHSTFRDLPWDELLA